MGRYSVRGKVPYMYRFLAVFLALFIFVGDIPSFMGSAADTGDDFQISVKWNGEEDPDVYQYDSDTSESRIIRAKIMYENKQAKNNYAPNEIIITFPGLKGAMRNGSEPLYAIAADKAGAEPKNYDWSYTYSAATNTYTFTNNEPITVGSALQGSFEIMWEVNSRNSVEGFVEELKAKLRSAYNDQCESNTISYSQTRKKDTFNVSESANGITTPNIPVMLPSGEKYNDYYWVEYDVRSGANLNARGLSDSEYDLWFLEDAIVGSGLTATGNTKLIDGKTYKCYRMRGSAYDGTHRVVVAYPRYDDEGNKIEYTDGIITNYVELYGTFYEEKDRELLSDTQGTVRVYDYERQIDGEEYAYGKTSRGVNNSYISAHDSHCYSWGAVRSTDLSGSDHEYYSSLGVTLNYGADPAKYQDIEVVDDKMEVELKDSTVRRLGDSEYNFTSVTIPSYSGIINRYKSTEPIDLSNYEVDIYVRRSENDEFDTDPYKTVKMTSSSQKINVPEDTVGVKVIFKGIDQDFSGDVGVYYKFHTEAEDIKTNGGRVTNYATMTFSREGVVSHSGGVQDYLHILEIPNRFSVSNNIAKTKEDREYYYFNGSINANIELEEGNDLSKFSLYTIVPEGLELNELYDTPQELKNILGFSCSKLSSGYIAEHTDIKIVKNYKGSGRTYIAFNFNFSDKPVFIDGIDVTGIPMYEAKDSINVTDLTFSHTMYAAMLIDQKGIWYSSSTDNAQMDGGIWNDIDGDRNTGETACFSNNIVTVVLPEFSNLQLIKSSKTELSGQYVHPGLDGSMQYVQDEIPQTYRGKEYSYKLRMETGENVAKNIIFVDNIEDGERAKWQGKFVSVDYSAAEKIYGVRPTIYYSEKSVDTSAKPNLTNTAVWKKAKPDKVRAIAVDFGNLEILSGKNLYVEVVMESPAIGDETVSDFTITENKFSSYYECYDEVGRYIGPQSLNSTEVPVEVIPFMGTIRITKQDSTSKEKLPGARFNIYRMEGSTPDKTKDTLVQEGLTSNQSGIAVSERLKYGSYYIEETEAPLGYKKSDELIEVGLNDTEPDKVVEVTIDNERKPGQFTITKTSDRNSSAKLQGARFAVYRSDGTQVYDGYNPELVTDMNGELIIDGLPWGEYYAVEIEAPKGYIKSDKQYPFTVSSNTDAGRMESANAVNEQIPASATLTKYETLEDGKSEQDVPISGAGYTLYDSTDKLLGTYMTDEDGKIYVEDLTFGKYYFVETVAAEGYEKFEGKVEFTVDAEHTDVALGVVTRDTRMTGKMWLQKVDDTGAYVVGAEYGLFRTADDVQVDKTGNPSSVVFTTKAEGIIDEEGLYWGDYYLKEVKAPKGYELNETHYPVVVNRKTVNNRIIINAVDSRAKGIVELKKVAKDDNSRTLEGAVFTLYKSDGSIYKDDIKTGADGTVRVEEIDWGSYYFVEKTAPAGYGLNPDKVRFSVNYLTADKVQYLTVEDPEISCELIVTKRIRSDQTLFAHGNPTFTFKIEGTDTSGKSHTYFRNLAFTEDYCNAHTGSDGYVEQSIVISGLPQGTWTVTEIKTIRYTDTTWDSLSGNVTTSAPQDPTYRLIGSNDLSAHVRFTNLKEVQSSTSHNSTVTNVLKRSRKYTGLVAVWNGRVMYDTKLNRSYLDVYAVYDDGSQVKLPNDAYTLNQEEFDVGVQGSYTITAEHEEDGVTHSDSFEITVNVYPPFTWEVLSDKPFTDTDGTEYDGTVYITGYTGTSTVLSLPKKVTGLRQLTDRGDNQSTGTITVDESYGDKNFKVVEVRGYSIDRGSWTEYKPMYGVQNIETLVIPDSVVTIGDYAFSDCSGLTGELVIPNSVVTIGSSAFNYCSGLTSLKLGEKVETIGSYAFYECKKLTGGLEIPDNVVTIGDYAFYECGNLTSLKLGEKVETIAEGAFRNCSGLTGGLEIPNSVVTIGDYAFYNVRLMSLQLGEKVETIGSHAFHVALSTPILRGKLVIPDSVVTIGDYAFAYCTGLTGELVIPDNVVTIGDSAFEQCGFTDLKLGEKVETIGRQAFCSCSRSASLKLGENVKTIGQMAFANCRLLTGEVKVPQSVETIGNNAFRGTNCNPLRLPRRFEPETYGCTGTVQYYD